MSGQVVGTISIKVTPDTTGFRQKLHAELEAIERGEAAHVKVEADFDANGLKGKVEAAAKSADATTKIKVDVDENGLRRKLDMLNIAFENRVSKALEKKPLMPDSLAEMQRRMSTLDLGWDRKVRAALDEFNKPIRLQLDEEFSNRLRQNVLGTVERQINLKPHLDETGLEELRLRLAHENFTAKVKLETDTARLQNAARKVEADFDRALDRIFTGNGRRGLMSRLLGAADTGGGVLGKLTTKVPDLVPNIGGLGGAASLALIAAAASLAAPALSLFSQVMVTLPGIIAAVAAPIGVFALGLGGIKKAMEDADFLTADKKGKMHIGDVIKRIQEPINQIFEQGFKPLFQSVGQAMADAPFFTRGLQFIAQGIVSFAGGLTKSLTDSGSLANLDRMTNSIGTMLTNLAPGMTTFSNAMIKLTTSVTDHLPGAAIVMDGWIDRFSNWIDGITKPKTFWGKAMPSELDNAVSNMKPILDSVINFVGKLTDAGLKLAADPKMAENIKNVVDGITNAILALLPPLNALFNTLAPVLGGIQAPLPKPGDLPKGPDGKPLPSSIPPGLVLAPPNTPAQVGIPKGFEQDIANNPKAQEIIRQFDKDTAFDPNANGFQNLWRHLRRIFDRPDLDPAGVKPFVMEQGFGNQPKPPAPPRPPTQAEIAAQQNLQNLSQLAAGPPQPPQQPLPAPVAPPAKGQVPQVGQEAQAQADAAKKAFDGIAPAAQAAMQATADAVKAGSAQVVATFVALGPQLVGAINGIQGLMVGAGVNLAAGLAAGIRSGIPAVAAAGAELAKAAETAATGHLQIHSPSRLFMGIGENTAAGFQTGLENGFQGVIQSATSLVDQLQGSINNGMLPAGLRDNVKSELRAIGQEYDRLKVQRDQLDPKDKAGRQAVSGQMRQLQTLRDQLKYGQDQLGPAKGKNGESTDSMSQAAQLLTKQVASTIDLGKNFVMANVNQVEQDLGISGQGAIPTIANIGLQWGSQMLNGMVSGAFGMGGKGNGGDTHFHVQSTDQAMALQRAEQARKGMTYAGR